MDEFYIFLLVVLVLHLMLWFFDVFFKSCSHYPYLQLIKNTGLEIKFLRLHWFTTAFNRQIQKWGTIRPRLQQAWFMAGTWVSLALFPFAVFLIVHSCFMAIKQAMREEGQTGKDTSVILVEPMVPGLNMPSSDYVYYILSLLISSVVHEMGHAMAAIREDAHVVGFSFTFLFIIPIAMTHLEGLELLPAIRQLRVMTAGVWNNVFLAIVTAILATSLPWLVYPFYDFGSGVNVEYIKPGSPISSPHGLQLKDKITQINRCPVVGTSSWQDCLVQMLHEPDTGFCIPDVFIKEHDESVPAKHLSEGAIECCAANNPSHLCFEYAGTEDEPLPIPQHSCLNARSVIEVSPVLCAKSTDCPSTLHCFKPSLGNLTRLFKINRQTGKDVLYIGHPAELFHTVQVSDFIPLYPFLPSSIPDSIIKLCQYITLFSSGLAILNIIPCYHFDGQFIVVKTLDAFLNTRIPVPAVRQAIALCLSTLGSFLICIYLILMIFTFG